LFRLIEFVVAVNLYLNVDMHDFQLSNQTSRSRNDMLE